MAKTENYKILSKKLFFTTFCIRIFILRSRDISRDKMAKTDNYIILSKAYKQAYNINFTRFSIRYY